MVFLQTRAFRALLSLRSKLGFEFLLSDDGFGRHYGNGITKPFDDVRKSRTVDRELIEKYFFAGSQQICEGIHA